MSYNSKYTGAEVEKFLDDVAGLSFFEFSYDSATNKATAEMVAALAEAIAADKLILCNGRTYKFILEQDGMYGLVSDAYMDIMDGKLKTSILAVTASTYDVQLMEQEVETGTEITESTISGWGFTKNAGTITGIKMNGASKGTSGVVDLGNVLTEHQKLKTINGESIVGSGNIEIQGGGATPRVEMTEATAELQPNTFHVWPMMDSLDLTLGAEQTGVMNRYLFQFRNPKEGLTMLTLPDDITWSEDTELDENGMPVMEATAFYRIEIIEGLASLKKWKLVYIQFADAEVERVLMSKGVGDGIGITKRDAAAVTDIGTWFQANSNITSFHELRYFTGLSYIPAATASYYNAAFYNCINLQKITIPINVTKIGGYAFSTCSSLSECTILGDVTIIADSAFYNCTLLTGEMNFPNLTTLEAGAFYATAINKIHIGNVVGIEGNYAKGAFQSCVNLTEIVHNGNLAAVGDYSCYKCSALQSIDLSSVTSLGSHSFDACSHLSVVGSLTNVTTMKDSALRDCKALAIEVCMPNLTKMERGAFYGSAITGVISIGSAVMAGAWNNGVFQNCSSMTFCNLPAETTTIVSYDFSGCSKLQILVVNAATPPSLSGANILPSSLSAIYVPATSVETYKTAQNWSAYSAKIKPIVDLSTDSPDIYAKLENYIAE